MICRRAAGSSAWWAAGARQGRNVCGERRYMSSAPGNAAARQCPYKARGADRAAPGLPQPHGAPGAAQPPDREGYMPRRGAEGEGPCGAGFQDCGGAKPRPSGPCGAGPSVPSPPWGRSRSPLSRLVRPGVPRPGGCSPSPRQRRWGK